MIELEKIRPGRRKKWLTDEELRAVRRQIGREVLEEMGFLRVTDNPIREPMELSEVLREIADKLDGGKS